MRSSLAVLSLLAAVGAPVAAHAADYPDHPVYRAPSAYERTTERRVYEDEPVVEERVVVRRPPPVVEERVYVEDDPVVYARPRWRPYGFYGPRYVRGPGWYGPRWRRDRWDGPGWRGPRAHWVHRRW